MILFIDDELKYMDSFVRDLSMSGYQVNFQKDVDGAWRYFEENTNEIELLILDIMMPPGETFKDKDTDDGLRTGVHFYKRVRESVPGLPVIVLTNVSAEEVKARFQGEDNCSFFQKKDYLPFQIVQEVRRILSPLEIDVEGHQTAG
jgi:DNA-binding response OmpR family regulator